MTAAEREAAILSLRSTVMRISRQRKASIHTCMRLDDIVSAGWLGAIEAVDQFDPGKGTTLAAFSEWRIRGAILDYLRGLDPVSRDERRRFKANPDLEPPRTFSLHAINHDDRVLEFGDKRSHAAFREVEARLTFNAILTRAKPLKPRSLRMVMRHAHGETMKAIGKSEGCNESRVSQICKRTLAELRAAA